MRKSMEETIKDAQDHAFALITERQSRDPQIHLDDSRVATEIAAHQFALGRLEKLIVEQNNRWVEAHARNVETIKTIRATYANLQSEMDIATHRNLPRLEMKP